MFGTSAKKRKSCNQWTTQLSESMSPVNAVSLAQSIISKKIRIICVLNMCLEQALKNKLDAFQPANKIFQWLARTVYLISETRIGYWMIIINTPFHIHRKYLFFYSLSLDDILYETDSNQ
jgi:hypothetical protein